MKKGLVVLIVCMLFICVVTPVFAGGGGHSKYKFKDEYFEFSQCYSTEEIFPGPAETLGEDVCVGYEALNSEVVHIRENGDLNWVLHQSGTATIFAQDDGEVLYHGKFKVEEIARDLGGDAGCTWGDGQHAWAGLCTSFFSNLDFLEYHWKIQGASVYFFDATIRGAGNWCYSSKQSGEVGPGCK